MSPSNTFEGYGLLYYGWTALLLLGLVKSASFVAQFLRVRRRMRKLQKQGLSMPPHSFFWGHLMVVDMVAKALPPDATAQYHANELQRRFPDLGGTFYLDLWPFVADPFLVCASVTTLHQVTQEHSLPKYPWMKNFVGPIAGRENLLTMEGQTHKTWRSTLNPCFSASHLISLLPMIVQDAVLFSQKLDEKARGGEVFRMKELTDDLVIDVIGRTVLNKPFDCQKQRNPMIEALRRQIPWMLFGNGWNPVRPLVHWYNSRIVDRYITQEFEDQLSLHQTSTKAGEGSFGKTLIDLIQHTYLQTISTEKHIDEQFKSTGLRQIKLFLFAGTDSTSTTACYLYHILSEEPDVVKKLRAEHESVLGSNIDTASTITSQPKLLNHVPYTTAVIKETLRLFPPLSSTRAGEAGFSASDDDGRQYPTENCLIWSVHHAIQRDPKYWPDPDLFLPERWLVQAEDPLYPVKGAWRPFEHGPRGCIGQELAMMTMKLMLILTVRKYDVKSAYEEWDRSRGVQGNRTVRGERAYQAWNGTPTEGIPCRVEMTKGEKVYEV